MKEWSDIQVALVVIGGLALVFGIIYLVQDHQLAKNFADMVYTIGK